MPLSKTHEKMIVFFWKFNPSQLKCMKIHENTWKLMEIHENTWKYMKINENSWKLMKIHWKLHTSAKTTKDIHINLLREPPKLPEWLRVSPSELQEPPICFKITPRWPQSAPNELKKQSKFNPVPVIPYKSAKKIAIVAPSALISKKSSQQAEYDI